MTLSLHLSLALVIAGIPHETTRRITGEPNELFAIDIDGGGDTNADGVPDILVFGLDFASGNSGLARVYSGLDGSELQRFPASQGSALLGKSVAFAGDVDADGHDDVIVGDSDLAEARVHSGRDGALLHRFVGDDPSDGFGGAVAAAGDVDRDGYADVIVSTVSLLGQGSEYVRIFSGRDGARLRDVPARRVGDRFGVSVAGAGDLNGDGTSDLLVGAMGVGRDAFRPPLPPFLPARWEEDGAGAVFAFCGASGTLLYSVMGDSEGQGFGYSVQFAGDVNGDGCDDFVAGSSSEEAPAGSAMARLISGRDGTVLQRFVRDRYETSTFDRVAGIGDVNRDGYADVIVARSGAQGRRADAIVFSGADGAELRRYHGGSALAQGIRVAGAGDLDGDGVPDFMVGVGEAFFGGGFVDVLTSGLRVSKGRVSGGPSAMGPFRR